MFAGLLLYATCTSVAIEMIYLELNADGSYDQAILIFLNQRKKSFDKKTFGVNKMNLPHSETYHLLLSNMNFV